VGAEQVNEVTFKKSGFFHDTQRLLRGAEIFPRESVISSESPDLSAIDCIAFPAEKTATPPGRRDSERGALRWKNLGIPGKSSFPEKSARRGRHPLPHVHSASLPASFPFLPV
jgi:hypothetical protein